MYDVATVTPLERPAEAGGRLVISNEEAAAAEAYDLQREAKDAAPLKGDRGAPPVGGERVATKTWLEAVEQFAGGGRAGTTASGSSRAGKSSPSMARSAAQS